MVQRKLGRGLQALLGGYEDDAPPPTLDAPVAGAGPMLTLPTDQLTPNPYQPRRHFDPAELAGLVESIKQHGVIQPILVRQAAGQHQVVAGERRLRAAQQAGLATVPVRILQLDDRQTFELALVENLQRADLNPIDKAQAFEAYLGRFDCTHEQLAGQLGLDRSTVTNLIRLLELPAPVQEAVRLGQISNGHARALLALEDRVEQVNLCQQIIADGLTVRQIETLAREKKAKQPAPTTALPTPKSNHVVSIESELRQWLGAKVNIQANKQDKGTITIHFASNDEFERVMDLLRGKRT